LLASLLGALLASTLADDQLANWGWRIPFLIGAGLGLVGMWMRRDMAETERFVDNVAKARAIKNPLMLTLREYPKSVAQLIGVTLLSPLFYYTFFAALPPSAVRGRGGWCSGLCRPRPRCSWRYSPPSAGRPPGSAASRRCSCGRARLRC